MNPEAYVVKFGPAWQRARRYVLTSRVRVGERRIAGRYVYPPTLALWIARLRLNAALFVLALLASIQRG